MAECYLMGFGNKNSKIKKFLSGNFTGGIDVYSQRVNIGVVDFTPNYIIIWNTAGITYYSSSFSGYCKFPLLKDDNTITYMELIPTDSAWYPYGNLVFHLNNGQMYFKIDAKYKWSFLTSGNYKWEAYLIE